MKNKTTLLKSFLFLSVITISPLTHAFQTENDIQRTVSFKDTHFPNYFEGVEKDLLENALQVILDNLEVPFVPRNTLKNKKEIERTGFFKELKIYSNDIAPNAEIYISGGVVRSLLGYIYERLYKERIRYPYISSKDVLENLIAGKKGNGKEKQVFTSLEVLGIGSDLDILIDFPENFAPEKKELVLNDLTDFINSAESFFNLRNEEDVLKKSLILVGDVKDYQKQIVEAHDKNAVYQGGSSLDWLAFSVNLDKNVFREPAVAFRSLSIIDDFFKGEVAYFSHCNASETTDKQTLRGIRSLLELPHLTFTKKGFEIFKAEVEYLISLLNKGEKLSEAAKLQLQKMTRNARFGADHNRFLKSQDPVDVLLRGLFTVLAEKGIHTVIEFSKKIYIPSVREDKGNLKENKILLTEEEIDSRFKDGIHHGTPDLTSILSMIRNGFYISNSKQGTAVYGPGVYAATDKNVAEEYAKGKGVVLSVPLKLTKDLRILDLGKISETKDLLKTLDCKNNDELFGILQARYDIDAIIPENQPAYLVVQNASILKMPKDFSLLLKKQLKTIDSELKTISSKTSWYDSKEGIDKALNNLHPTGAFRALASMCKVNQEEYHDIFGRYLRKLLEKKPLPVFHILSKGWSYWEDQHEGFVNELASGQKENLPKDFTSNPKKWVELIQRIKIAAGPNVSNNMTFSDLHILEVIKLSQLTDFSEDQDTLINCFYSLKSIVYEINEIIGWRGDLNPFHFWHIFLKVSKNLTNEQRSEVVSTFLSNGKINEWSRKKLHLIKLLTDCVTHKHTEFGYPFNNASLDTTLDGYVAEKFKEILVEFEKVSGSSYLSDPSWDLIEKQGFNTLEILKCLGELKAAVGLNADKFFYKEIFSDFLNSGLMEHKDKESILKMLTMLQQDNYGLTFNKKTTYHTTIFGEPVTHAYDAGIFEVINLVKELSCLDKFGLLNKLCYFKSQNDYMIFDQFKKLYEEQKTMPTCLQGVDLKKEKQGYTTYLGFIGEDALNDEISIYNERLKKIYKKYNEVTFYLID